MTVILLVLSVCFAPLVCILYKNLLFNMENYPKMYKNICRLCLSSENSDKFVSLIENDGLSCYGESVLRFAHISIEKGDNLPKNMCQKCLFLLKCAIYFKFRCEKSEIMLDEWSSKHIKNNRRKTNLAKVNNQSKLFASDSFPNFEKSRTDKQQSYNETANSTDSSLSDEGTNPNVHKKSDVLKILKRNLRVSRNKFRKNKKFPKGHKYECEICKKVLSNPVTYSHHMEYHSGCKFICEHCGKGFPVLPRLQIHQIAVHKININPYLSCQFCSFLAPTKIKLTEHERLHTGERPFTCDKCGLTFRRQAIWKKHLVHHTEKSVQCLHCPRKFFTMTEMKTHSNNVHERRYMYSCYKCNTTYAKNSSVRRHLTDVHGIPREMQGKIVRINSGKPNDAVEP
ncbi:zinc finger protein 737-like [Plodia interpunctella]|uniref:zinc finger protein 737-like n=1 Tax=Plodia interpunctella TaxID=58824 RepID=UPI0023685EBC|nr:zinc finger protein 737-like [Plodia interpunctella]